MFKGGSERIVSIEMQEYPAEIEQGNVEYKLKLLNKTNERIDQLTSQLKWRLQEGNGQAIYQIGVADCGEKIGLNQKGIILANASEMSDSIKTLINMTKRINAQAHTIKTREVRKGFLISEVQIRKLENTKFTEIRVAILGGADAGKSTLISMLCFNEKDDGKGKARLNLLRHRHEIESGRSSSLARQIIGFSATGNMINYSSNRISSWENIGEQSSKIITFMDTCGHPKYEQTTIGGLTGDNPEYSILVLSASYGGLPKVSKEQIMLTKLLEIPLIIFITKIDIARGDDLSNTLHELMMLLKSPDFNRVPVVIQNSDDLRASMDAIMKSTIVPLFLTSSVTLENRDLLINLFNSLKKPLVTDKLLESELEFQIQQVYNIDDTCVVGGSAVSGRIHISGKNVQEFYLGPDRGRFIKVNVNSLQRQRCIVKNLQAGQTGTMALKFRDLQTGKWIEKPSLDFRIRRGQVLLSTLETPVSFWEFEVDLFVLSHPACLIPGHALKIFCGTIAQQAKVITIESSDTQNIIKSTKVEGLDDMNDLVKQLVKPPKKKRRTSDVVGLLPGLHGRVTFGFINESEYLSIGSTVVIRGSGIKCVGKIVSLRKQH